MPEINNLPHAHNLPTIVEQSVTAAASQKPEEKPKITDIFPDIAMDDQLLKPTVAVPPARRHSGRMRTTSESNERAMIPGSRFQVNQQLDNCKIAGLFNFFPPCHR